MTSKHRIVALVGPKRSGKDTVAEFLSKFGYINFKLAQRIKNICKEMFGFTDEELETDKKDILNDKWGASPRKIMQVFGTEIAQYEFRNHGIPSVGKTFWVERFAEDLMATRSKVVITDMRFIHEYEYLYNQFGDSMLVIKLLRPECANNNDMHISEREWLSIPADVIIMNDSTVESLHEKIANILQLR